LLDEELVPLTETVDAPVWPGSVPCLALAYTPEIDEQATPSGAEQAKVELEFWYPERFAQPLKRATDIKAPVMENLRSMLISRFH
jgi:hypothetical protein